MIEKMKKVVLISRGSEKKELLLSLREEGVMHVSDLVHKTPKLDEMEKDRSDYVRIRQVLVERADKKDKRKLSLSDSEFASVHQAILKDIEDEGKINERLVQLQAERDRIKPFGDFNPDDVKALSDDGIPIFIYAGGKKEIEKLRSDESVSFIPLRYDGKLEAAAVLYEKLPESSGLTEISLPSESLSEIEAEILMERKRLDEIRKRISECGVYITAYDSYLRKADERITFERVSSTISGDDIIYLKGYIPEKDEKRFMKKAEKEGWAYIIDDISDEDNPPTLVRYKGITRIVKPIFDILGTVPGYREYDISSFFLVFFSLFFAMILGDAGYGLIFLTWFGSETILRKLPFLQLFIVPAITNFPGVVGVDSVWAQNMLMKFCFILGAVQLGLARVVNIITKARNKDISLIAEAGWFIDVVMLYLMALYLVIGEAVPFTLIVGGIVVGFVLVCLFSGQGPGISFVAGLKAGLAGFFTTFLDTISCFSNIMSYIRLFAVGMASLAIAQSFNGMAGGMLHGALIPIGVLIIVLGHTLNLVMGMLSVVVHGVRLNLLEFSGALGMEWTGYNYEPFSKMADDKAAENS